MFNGQKAHRQFDVHVKYGRTIPLLNVTDEQEQFFVFISIYILIHSAVEFEVLLRIFEKHAE